MNSRLAFKFSSLTKWRLLLFLWTCDVNRVLNRQHANLAVMKSWRKLRTWRCPHFSIPLLQLRLPTTHDQDHIVIHNGNESLFNCCVKHKWQLNNVFKFVYIYIYLTMYDVYFQKSRYWVVWIRILFVWGLMYLLVVARADFNKMASARSWRLVGSFAKKAPAGKY